MVTCRTLTTDSDSKDSATQTASEDVWKKETSEYLISTAFQAVLRACRRRAVPVRRASTDVQQVETTAAGELAHVQQFAVALRRRRQSSDGRAFGDMS